MKKAIFIFVIAVVLVGMAGTADAVSYKAKSVREIMKVSQTVKANNVSVIKKVTEAKDPCVKLWVLEGKWKEVTWSYPMSVTMSAKGNTCSVQTKGNKGEEYTTFYEGTEMPIKDIYGDGMYIYIEGPYLLKVIAIDTFEKYKKVN